MKQRAGLSAGFVYGWKTIMTPVGFIFGGACGCALVVVVVLLLLALFKNL